MAVNWGSFLGSALSGLGGGLMQAGSPGGNFSQGFMGGSQAFGQQQAEALMQKYRQQQMQMQQQQMDAQDTANQDAATEKAQIQQAIAGGGMMSPNGFSQSQFGGAPQAPSLFDPQTSQQLQGLPYSLQKEAVGAKLGQMFAEPKDNSTPDQREYKQAVEQGFQGTFLDYITAVKKAGASNTNVDIHAPTGPSVGTITPDYILTPDGNGGWTEKVIPGSKTDLEQKSAADKAAVAKTTQIQTGDIVTEDIARVLKTGKDAVLPTSGMVGGVLSGIPGTAAYDTSKLLDTVKANIGFDKLQAMRNASPTGGALGQVSDTENRMLQATLGSVEQSQGTPQFEYNLKRLYNLYLDTIHGKDGGPDRLPLDDAPSGQASSGGDLHYDGEGNLVQ